MSEELQTQHILAQANHVQTRLEAPKGLLDRATRHNELLGELESKIRDTLDRIRGSNVKHLEKATEPIPTGMPSTFDQIERRLQNCLKQFQDLVELF